jgi:DNA recombination protein RmuC
LKIAKNELSDSNQALATAKANNEALNEKLQTQRDEMEALGKKFNTEFENIANKILETKTEKFTELNKTNLKTYLEPLGKNITEFKTKVEEVYDKESKERFSLGEKVKELAQLNKVISEEAHNLTKALKGESKTQGGWGEMILENILEKSGL